MKKVLALVLAVIMVCTMAMALSVASVNTGIASVTIGSNTNYGTVTLEADKIDDDGYAYVALGDTVFNLLGASTTADITAKNFKVTVSATPAIEVVFAKDGGAYLKLVAADKPLDGKIEYTISSVKVEKIGAGTNYAYIVADKGVLVMDTVVRDGHTIYSIAKKIGNAADYPVKLGGEDIPTTWDVGFATNEVSPAAGKDLALGWNKASEKTTEAVSNNFALVLQANTNFDCGKVTLAKDATIKVTKYDDSKSVWTNAMTEATGAVTKASAEQKIASPYVAYNGGIVLTEATTFTLVYGDNYNLYTLNNDGTVSPSSFKFVDGKGWQLTAKEMPITVVTTATLTTTVAPAEGTTTTNPGTGANDVVGVAAALAVVALVSGAAISLKK